MKKTYAYRVYRLIDGKKYYLDCVSSTRDNIEDFKKDIIGSIYYPALLNISPDLIVVEPQELNNKI